MNRTCRASGSRPWLRTVGHYLGLGAVVSALTALLLRPWSGGWATPVVYGNDTLSVLAMVDAAGWSGTARGVPGLGAPHGAAWFDFPLGPDRLHLVAVRLLRALTGDTLVAVNLYWFVGFVLVAFAAFGVLRHLRVSVPVAAALSIALTLAPYHFVRLGLGHLFLAAYFAVPLGVLLALWATDGSLEGPAGARRRWWAAAWVLVVGSASAYYAVFAIVLVASLGVAVAVRRSSWRALVAPAVIAVAIGGVVVANVAGDLLTAGSAGANQEASLRPVSDVETYSLRPWSMLVPGPDHRVAPLGAVGERFDAGLVRGGGSYLGLLALVGLGVIAVRCLRTDRRQTVSDQGLYLRLGTMVVASVAVATYGGASALLAGLGFTQIRVWDRVSIVIAFIALVGLGPAIDRWIERRWARGSLPAYVVALALVAVVMVDQVSELPDRGTNRSARAADVEVADGLDSMLEPGGAVFQFPYVAFPGDVTDRGMPNYAHLGPWSAGDGSLTFSSGAMQGRGGDWQATWAAQEPVTMAAGLAAAGFDALLVDRRADAAPGLQTTTRTGAQFASMLRDELDLPSVRSSDASREWFDLRPLRDQLVGRWGEDVVDRAGRAVTRPIGVTYQGAATYTAAPAGVRLLEPDASITLRRENDDASGVSVGFELSGAVGSEVSVTWPGGSETVQLDRTPTSVRFDVELQDRDTIVVFELTDPAGADPGGASDGSVVSLSNLTVLDVDLAADREQLALSNS